MKNSVWTYLFISVRHKALGILQKQLLIQKHNPKLQEFMEYLLSTEYTYEEEEEIEQIKKNIERVTSAVLESISDE